jgi:hypothetical protein
MVGVQVKDGLTVLFASEYEDVFRAAFPTVQLDSSSRSNSNSPPPSL